MNTGKADAKMRTQGHSYPAQTTTESCTVKIEASQTITVVLNFSQLQRLPLINHHISHLKDREQNYGVVCGENLMHTAHSKVFKSRLDLMHETASKKYERKCTGPIESTVLFAAIHGVWPGFRRPHLRCIQRLLKFPDPEYKMSRILGNHSSSFIGREIIDELHRIPACMSGSSTTRREEKSGDRRDISSTSCDLPPL